MSSLRKVLQTSNLKYVHLRIVAKPVYYQKFALTRLPKYILYLLLRFNLFPPSTT